MYWQLESTNGRLECAGPILTQRRKHDVKRFIMGDTDENRICHHTTLDELADWNGNQDHLSINKIESPAV